MGGVRATIASRFALALAIGALILAPGLASAALQGTGAASNYSGAPVIDNPIFEQYADCTGSGAASQQFPDFADAVLQSADDFDVSGDQTLNQVVGIGSFGNPPAADLLSVTIEVYDGDGPGGLPGTLLCSETGLVPAGGNAEPTIEVALDQSCTLGTGEYWMSVLPVMNFGGGAPGQWFWSSNATGFGSEFAFRDPDELLGPGPCNTWGAGQTTCGIGTTFPDLCMGIGAVDTGGDGDPTGTPAVGTTGVIVMLLVVMAISFFYLRRRQTA